MWYSVLAAVLVLASLAAVALFAIRRNRVNDDHPHNSPEHAVDTSAARTLRSIVQSVADALVIIDDRGLIRSFSPSAERTFGYDAAEVIGQSVSLLVPAGEREQHEGALRHYVEAGWASGRHEQLVLTGEAHIVRPERETVAVRKDGSMFPARLVVSEVETGRERLFVGLVSDLSERKRLERELADRHRQLEDAYGVIEAQKQRMQNELDVGRQIQSSMVPSRFPELPEVDLWATLRPAREVGGDFYDFFTRSAHELWIAIGDVSGKGVPAALLMAVTKTLIKSFATQGFSAGEVCTRVNAELARDNDRGMFVTAFVACLDLRSGVLRYANAGHNPPLLLRKGGRLDRYETRHGPVLGATEEATYGNSNDCLAAGDVLLLYTDGVTEALDAKERLFTEARLRDVVLGAPDASARELTRAVVSAVDTFAAGVEQADDISVLAIRFTGGAGPKSPRCTLQVPNELTAIPRAVAEVERLVLQWGGDLEVQRRFALAFDELLSNIIKYAYPDRTCRIIDCELACENGAITGTIVDDGVPFNPLDHPVPDRTRSLEERPLGGVGVALVRGIFPEIRYRRLGSRNVLTLIERARSLRADVGR